MNMDYKYINQLLERYWECQTTLEEEAILRSFFSQEDIPASLLPYRELFVYEQTEVKENVLGEDFDAKMLSLIGEEKPVKARIVSMAHRLRPLMKAAAIVAIILTLGNAMQVPFNSSQSYEVAGTEHRNPKGESMAKRDTAVVDSLHRTSLAPQEAVPVTNGLDNQVFTVK